jgi:hypothetical protein
MLSVVMLSVVMLSFVMLNGVAPLLGPGFVLSAKVCPFGCLCYECNDGAKTSTPTSKVVLLNSLA